MLCSGGETKRRGRGRGGGGGFTFLWNKPGGINNTIPRTESDYNYSSCNNSTRISPLVSFISTTCVMSSTGTGRPALSLPPPPLPPLPSLLLPRSRVRSCRISLHRISSTCEDSWSRVVFLRSALIAGFRKRCFFKNVATRTSGVRIWAVSVRTLRMGNQS